MELKPRQIIQEKILDSPEPLTPESDLFEAGLAPMAIMQLLLHIEDQFQIHLEPADNSRKTFRTTSKIVVLISAKRLARPISLHPARHRRFLLRAQRPPHLHPLLA